MCFDCEEPSRRAALVFFRRVQSCLSIGSSPFFARGDCILPNAHHAAGTKTGKAAAHQAFERIFQVSSGAVVNGSSGPNNEIRGAVKYLDGAKWRLPTHSPSIVDCPRVSFMGS